MYSLFVPLIVELFNITNILLWHDFYLKLQLHLIFSTFTFQLLSIMKTRFFLLFIFTVVTITHSVALPPPPPPPDPGDAPGCWPPPCIPIDGGISLLIAAGVVYGGRKLYVIQKEKKSL